MNQLFSIAFLLLALASQAADNAPARPPLPIQSPPIPPSPIEEFRGWLKLSPEEREKALSDWPEPKRQVLLEKLRAYETLPADQQERRLKMLELRWYLLPLMSLAPTERSGRIQMVPARLQELVVSRLDHWDKLDESARKEILANEKTLDLVANYLAQIQRGRSPGEVLQSLNPERRNQMSEALRVWNETNPAQRQKMAAQLSEFFNLPKEQQTRALGSFSEKDRQEMQKTLDSFAGLHPTQRRACVDSFQKFATMNPGERNLFLKNAARWQSMTPHERETWKKLVRNLPPLPPLPTLLPPAPGSKSAHGPTDALAATNLPTVDRPGLP